MATRRPTASERGKASNSASGRALGHTTATRSTEGLDASDPANIELVFGFVGPTGIDLNKVCDALRAQLRAVQYEVVEVRLSELITTYLGKSQSFEN